MISLHLWLVLGIIVFNVILLWIFVHTMGSKVSVLIEDCGNNQRSIDKLAKEIFWLRKGREGANPEIAEDW